MLYWTDHKKPGARITRPGSARLGAKLRLMLVSTGKTESVGFVVRYKDREDGRLHWRCFNNSINALGMVKELDAAKSLLLRHFTRKETP